MKKYVVKLDEYLVQDIDGLMDFWNSVADDCYDKDQAFNMIRFKSRSEFVVWLLHNAILDRFVIYRDFERTVYDFKGD